MRKRTLTERRDLWSWMEEVGIDESTSTPMAEDMPKYVPCVVVWDKEEGGKVRYLFVYVTDILELL